MYKPATLVAAGLTVGAAGAYFTAPMGAGGTLGVIAGGWLAVLVMLVLCVRA